MPFVFLLFLFYFPKITIHKWLNPVSGFNRNNHNNGYAGIMKRPITSIAISDRTEYTVHLIGGTWLNPVNGYDLTDYKNGYAGIKTKLIDAIAIKGTSYTVHVLNSTWLPITNKYDINNIHGYAGIFGKCIDAIMVKNRFYKVYVLKYFSIDNIILPNPKFIKKGTGLEGVPTQYNIKGMRNACCFLSICVIAGLKNVIEFINAREWCVANKYIDDFDNIIFIDKKKLAKLISEKFGSYLHDDWFIEQFKGHCYVKNKNNIEVFNSCGLGKMINKTVAY